MSKEGYCLVLGGGGAKGVYHAGVWQALRELRVPISAVVGNSVGALVAGFIAQNNIKGLDSVMANIGLNDLVSIPDKLVIDGEFKLTRSNFKEFISFRKQIFEKKGLDTSPLKKILNNHLDESKLRSLGIDLGVVTYSLSSFKPIEIFVDQMPEGTVLDYLLASATLPGFSATEINEKKYIDGGVHDNIPFAMAKNRGYKRIIVSDISGLGIKRRPEITGVTTVYIKNSIDMGGVLDFSKSFLVKYRYLGYLDTLKAFGKLNGHSYFIAPDIEIQEKIEKKLETAAVKKTVYSLLGKRADNNQQPDMAARLLLPPKMRCSKDLVYSLADCAASALIIERVKLYRFEDLIKEIELKAANVDFRIKKLKKAITGRELRSLIRQIKKISKQGIGLSDIQNCPWFYYRIVSDIVPEPLRPVLFSSITALYPETASCALFLKIIGKM